MNGTVARVLVVGGVVAAFVLGVWVGGVVRYGDRYLLFGDYDPDHPRYNVSVWVNDDLYTEFRRLDEAAVEPRGGDGSHADDFGVQDPSLIRVGGGGSGNGSNGAEYVMFANGHATKSALPRVQHYRGRIRPANATAG